MTYKKVGGLHFFSLGRFGITFFVKRKAPSITANAIGRAVKRKQTLARLRAAASMDDYDARFGSRVSYNPYFER